MANMAMPTLQSHASVSGTRRLAIFDMDWDHVKAVDIFAVPPPKKHSHSQHTHAITPPSCTRTHRLAIVDLDWDHVKAVDIFAVLRSFLPHGGELKRVTVYPSDYGLERMAEESAMGPQVRGAATWVGGPQSGVRRRR